MFIAPDTEKYKAFKEKLRNKEIPEGFPWESWEECDKALKASFDQVFYGKKESTAFGPATRLSEDCLAGLFGESRKKKA